MVVEPLETLHAVPASTEEEQEYSASICPAIIIPRCSDNKIRQASITKELLEITSAAMAMG